MSSLCLIVLSLGLGQYYDRAEWQLVPQFIPGVELIYRGICTEESLVPGVQHQRQYDLEMILLMQNKGPQLGSAVLQTSVSVRQPGNNLAGTAASPGSARLDLVEFDRRGGLHLRRQGPARPDSELTLTIPLDGPPLQETGAFFEMPLVPVNRLSYWEQHEDHRPLRGWQVLGVEQYIGTTCLKLRWTQQSADWKEPRADSTAWRRQETIWFAYQVGQVFRVERIIESREPGRTEPTHRIVTKYDLESRFRYASDVTNLVGGRFFEDRVDEIARYRKFQEEAAPLLAQPAQYLRNIDALLGRITAYVDSKPPTPYRKSLVHLKSRLERARTGEVPISVRTAAPAVDSLKPLGIGQKVPNCVVAELTSRTERNTHAFKEYLGQPVLVLYYDPASAVGKEVLLLAQKLCDTYGDDLQVLGMAVSDDLQQILRQHEELDLSFPILDGKAMTHAFGVDGTPRVVLLDGDGLVRYAVTGWGFHSPAELAREIRALMAKK